MDPTLRRSVAAGGMVWAERGDAVGSGYRKDSKCEGCMQRKEKVLEDGGGGDGGKQERGGSKPIGRLVIVR